MSFFLYEGMVIRWKSSFQFIIDMSTTEVENMVVEKATREALWLVGLVKELCVKQGGVQLRYV